MYKITFYKDKQGRVPITEYLSSLEQNALKSKNERIKLKKIYEHMEILMDKGTWAGEPYVKHIDGNIWELRPTNDRFFFFYWENDTFVMLHYYTKKTKKAPPREIAKAKHNLKDFIERRKSGENW